MTKYRNLRRLMIATTTALMLGLPAIAGATTIGLSGTINNVNAFGPAPFAVGDTVAGSFDVDLNADNSFAIGDLNIFNLTVGSNLFNLGSSDFVNFSGALSSDGTTVNALSFLSNFVPSTAGTTFNLAFDVNNQPFAITSPFSGIGEATLAANVANNVAVPEPRAALIFSFALVLLALGVIARRRHLG